MRDVMRIVARTVLAGALMASSPVAGLAQVAKRIDVEMTSLGDGKSARLFNRALTVTREGARVVARLDARPGDGSATIEGIALGDGIIEVDLKGRDLAQQSFLGIAFHAVDATEFDAVYFRPFNFRAAAPEARSHAVQYVSHPTYTWQKLRAERTGQFEEAIEPPPDPNAWFHVRIVLAKGRVEVYVNDAETSAVWRDTSAPPARPWCARHAIVLRLSTSRAGWRSSAQTRCGGS